MQFTRLRLSNWRNFTEVEASLSLRVFLVGANASGKSNLLDAFRFLRDVVKPGGGFQKAVMDRGGVKSLRCFAARRYSDIAVEVEAGLPSDPAWRYRVEFNQDPVRRPILRKEQVWKCDKKILDRPNKEDSDDPARLTQTHIEQVNQNKDFRELARFFESVDYMHLVPQIIRDPDRYISLKRDPFGGDFLQRIASTTEKTRKSRLDKIQRALQVAVPQLNQLRLERDDRGMPHLKALYEHWRPKAGWQTEKDLSDGTLRLLGLLWSMLEGGGPLLLEEPELSLHQGVVRRLASLVHRLQRIRNRQVLISTHSYDLISDKGIGGEEVLVFEPSTEGTRVAVGKSDRDIRALLLTGVSLAEAVLPRTEPREVQQLELFPE